MGAKDKAKSIFDSLNDIKGTTLEERVNGKSEPDNDEEFVDESGTKYVNNMGNTEKVKDDSDDKISQRKREILKQARKDGYSDNKVTVNTEDEKEVEKDKDESEPEEVGEVEIEVSTDESNISMSEKELSQLKNVIEALKVPDNILNAFEEENYKEVFNYLKEEHSIEFKKEIESDVSVNTSEEKELTTEDSEQDNGESEEGTNENIKVRVKNENRLDLKEGTRLGILEDNYATSDKRKWDKSLVVYESEDNVVLEFKGNCEDNLSKFRFIYEEEGVDRFIYLDRDEVNQILK